MNTLDIPLGRKMVTKKCGIKKKVKGKELKEMYFFYLNKALCLYFVIKDCFVL